MTLTETTHVRDRLAARQSATDGGDPGAAPSSPAQMVRVAIERQAEAFQAVLPSVVDPERFGRLVLTAIKGAPDLMECFASHQGQTSVLLAAMQAAAIGLEPNTPTQDCWLLPRRDRRAGTMECQLSIGYRGYMKLARRSGNIESIAAEVVRERDHFVWSRGLLRDVFEHTEATGDRGEIVAAYAIVRYKDGGYSFKVLNRVDLDARRAMSDSWKNERSRPYSPWTKWHAQMCCKSAIRALVPYLDLSADVERAMSSDEARISIDDESGLIDITAQPFELDAGDGPAAPPPADLAAVPDPGPFADDNEVAEAVVVGEVSDDPMSEPQRKALHALLRKVHNAAGDARFPVLSSMLGREITSTNEISKAEASLLIDALQDTPEDAA